MRLRYRILTGRMDKQELGNVARDLDSSMRVGRARGGPLALLLAFAETPRKVIESDGEGELLEVRRMLRECRIGTHDLVDPGDGWREARDFEPLADLCREIEGGESARRWRVGGAIAAVAAALAAMAYLLH